jgi:hypothetical protein
MRRFAEEQIKKDQRAQEKYQEETLPRAKEQRAGAQRQANARADARTDVLTNAEQLAGRPGQPGQLETTEAATKAEGNKLYDDFHAHDAEKLPLSRLLKGVKAAKKYFAGSKANIQIFTDMMNRQRGLPKRQMFGFQMPDVWTPEALAQAQENFATQQFQETYSDLPQDRQQQINDWIKDIVLGKTPADINITVRDLHGYYSELGRFIATKDLPSDIYLAAKDMQGHVGEMLEEMSPEFRKATNFWRDYKKVFYDPKSTVAKAFSNRQDAYTVRRIFTQAAGEPGTAAERGIADLRKYSPEAADSVQRMRNAEEVRRSIPAKETVAKPIPPEPTRTNLARELPRARMEAYEKAVDGVSQSGRWLLPIGTWRTMEGALEFTRQGVRQAIRTPLSMGMFYIARGSIVDFLDRPGTREWLGKDAAADAEIMSRLPPEYRAQAAARGMQLIQGARARGWKIAPLFIRFVGGNYAASQHIKYGPPMPVTTPSGQPQPYVPPPGQSKWDEESVPAEPGGRQQLLDQGRQLTATPQTQGAQR